LATAYFAMLITLLLCYKLIGGFSEHLMDPLGPLPLSIPWTAALGAVALSMSGVIYHTVRRDWDSNFLLWHVARPILGAVFASIAYFVIAGGVLASGGTPNPSTQPAAAAQPASSPTPSSAPAESPSPSPSASPSPSPSGGSGAITGGGTTTGGGIQNLF